MTHNDSQVEAVSDEVVEVLAHRTAWRYKKSTDPHHSDTYTFNRSTLLHFANKLQAALSALAAGKVEATKPGPEQCREEAAAAFERVLADPTMPPDESPIARLLRLKLHGWTPAVNPPLACRAREVTMPERIQLQRTKGWKMPENTVKVDRSTQWGNRYEVWRDDDDGWMVSDVSCHWPVKNKAEGVALAVEKYRQFITGKLATEIYPPPVVLHELRGKNLACWCKPGSPCHADVLLELANAPAGVEGKTE